ncbi:hypothetical protein CRUP_005358 [Coryphaenoides rupestris]|nr:hypothetical protein CRUP_005358 [Coryphaenoides rupestris]
MVTLSSVVRPLARRLLHRQLLSRHGESQRLVPARRCNLTACSSKYVLSQMHPMWQEPLAIPGGDRQSPIDIVVRKSLFDPQLKPLVPAYDPQTCQQIWNNGYSFLGGVRRHHRQVHAERGAPGRPVPALPVPLPLGGEQRLGVRAHGGPEAVPCRALKGGPLEDQFRLCQFHFHWGESNAWGSEHTVDRKLFPAEIGKRHEGLQKLVDASACGQTQAWWILSGFDPACLLPSNINDYWTYHGSLTNAPSDRGRHLDRHEAAHRSQPRPVFRSLLFTPAEEEVQKGMVNNFRVQQPLRGRTLAVFRSLLFTPAEEEVQKGMVNNFRVQQPLRGRTVRSSFSPFLKGAPLGDGEEPAL